MLPDRHLSPWLVLCFISTWMYVPKAESFLFVYLFSLYHHWRLVHCIIQNIFAAWMNEDWSQLLPCIMFFCPFMSNSGSSVKFWAIFFNLDPFGWSSRCPLLNWFWCNILFLGTSFHCNPISIFGFIIFIISLVSDSTLLHKY